MIRTDTENANSKSRWLLCATLWLAVVTGCDSVLPVRGEIDVAQLARSWPPYQPPVTAPPLQPDRQNTGSLTNGIPAPLIPPPVRPLDEWNLREIAIDSLGRIGTPAVPQVTEGLQDPDPQRRQLAARILGSIGPEAAAAVPQLIAALEDADPLVQKAAVRALGQIGPSAEDAVGPLLDLVDRLGQQPEN